MVIKPNQLKLKSVQELDTDCFGKHGDERIEDAESVNDSHFYRPIDFVHQNMPSITYNDWNIWVDSS